MYSSIGNRSIIIAEDNPCDLDLTKLALGELDLPNPILCCSDGGYLIEYFHNEENLTSTALVLLDLDLENIDGLTFMKVASENNWTVKTNIIIFTSRTSQDEMRLCKEMGIKSFLQKPSDLNEYFTAVQRLCSYWSQEPAGAN